jgi:hypothetical protein
MELADYLMQSVAAYGLTIKTAGWKKLLGNACIELRQAEAGQARRLPHNRMTNDK